MYDEETGVSESGGGSSGWGQRLKSLAILLAFLALTFALLYFVAQQNSRRYFLVAEEGNLVVKRGIFFPVGEKPYTPDEPRLAQAYASIPLPPEGFEAGKASFNERADLDQALFDLLIEWARDRIQSGDPSRLERGIAYLRRAETLPAYTIAQEQALATLEGQVAFYEAEHLLREGSGRIAEAVRRLDRARAAGVIDDQTGERLVNQAREQVKSLDTFIAKVRASAGMTAPPPARNDEPEAVELEGNAPPAVRPEASGAGAEVEAPEADAEPEAPAAEELPAAPEAARPPAPRAAPAAAPA
ncbi:MAG: hypothetical protein P1V51_18605, partial [Deltaproteobacteria bacterium]|nr:hypothetical protein [Deltaproteobacteria bacterium]